VITTGTSRPQGLMGSRSRRGATSRPLVSSAATGNVCLLPERRNTAPSRRIRPQRRMSSPPLFRSCSCLDSCSLSCLSLARTASATMAAFLASGSRPHARANLSSSASTYRPSPVTASTSTRPPTINPTPSACKVPCHHPGASACDQTSPPIPSAIRTKPAAQNARRPPARRPLNT
jgi:hypothetical protein